jgi:hypothetical protein
MNTSFIEGLSFRFISFSGEDSSISEGMYAKVQEPRGPSNAAAAPISGSARPGAMALEVNGKLGMMGQSLGIREHEYSRIRNVEEENLYFKVGSDSGR